MLWNHATLQRVASIQWAPVCSGHPSQPPFSQYKNMRHANFITANLISLNRIPTARFSSAGNKKRTQRTGITSIIPAVLAWLRSALCMIKTPDVCILILVLSDLGRQERHGSVSGTFSVGFVKLTEWRTIMSTRSFIRTNERPIKKL